MYGLQQVLGGAALTAIVNTGDDLTWHGLHVSPDIDSLVYALSGLLSRDRGWGVEGDTFHCLDQLRRLGSPEWFQIGDRDLALHMTRTRLLDGGASLSEATAEICRTLGISTRVLPMSDSPVETRVITPTGELSFQEYFVRDRWQPQVLGLRFAGSDSASPSSYVVEAIRRASAVVIAPSNPVTSIGPILAVPGIREALRETTAPIAAISPIVAGAAVSGPAGELMRSKGLPVSATGVAQAYAEFLRIVIADEQDRGHKIAFSNIEVRFADTMMRTDADKLRLAREVLEIVGISSTSNEFKADSQRGR